MDYGPFIQHTPTMAANFHEFYIFASLSCCLVHFSWMHIAHNSHLQMVLQLTMPNKYEH